MELVKICPSCQQPLNSIKDLKKIEIKILKFINHFQKTHQFSPSYLEIQHGLGIKSSSNLQRYLKDLKRKKFIDFIPASARDIKILKIEGWLNE